MVNKQVRASFNSSRTMKINILFCILGLIFCSFGQIPNTVSLKNINGKMVSFTDYPDAKGFIVIFTCNHCPFAKLYPKRLNDLNETYTKSKVPLIAINSMDTISYEEDGYLKMIQKAKKEHFSFPYLYDPTQETAKLFRAKKTPHAFIIWRNGDHFDIKYSGAIDDNGMNPNEVENPYICMALDELLLGKEVSISETITIGCQIYFRK